MQIFSCHFLSDSVRGRAPHQLQVSRTLLSASSFRNGDVPDPPPTPSHRVVIDAFPVCLAKYASRLCPSRSARALMRAHIQAPTNQCGQQGPWRWNQNLHSLAPGVCCSSPAFGADWDELTAADRNPVEGTGPNRCWPRLPAPMRLPRPSHGRARPYRLSLQIPSCRPAFQCRAPGNATPCSFFALYYDPFQSSGVFRIQRIRRHWSSVRTGLENRRRLSSAKGIGPLPFHRARSEGESVPCVVNSFGPGCYGRHIGDRARRTWVFMFRVSSPVFRRLAGSCCCVLIFRHSESRIFSVRPALSHENIGGLDGRDERYLPRALRPAHQRSRGPVTRHVQFRGRFPIIRLQCLAI